jgi:hypothetical protein
MQSITTVPGSLEGFKRRLLYAYQWSRDRLQTRPKSQRCFSAKETAILAVFQAVSLRNVQYELIKGKTSGSGFSPPLPAIEAIYLNRLQRSGDVLRFVPYEHTSHRCHIKEFATIASDYRVPSPPGKRLPPALLWVFPEPFLQHSLPQPDETLP